MVASGFFAFSALGFSVAKSPSSVTWRWSHKVVRINCAGLDALGFAPERARETCASAVATWHAAGAPLLVSDARDSEVHFVIVTGRPQRPAGFTVRKGDANTGMLNAVSIEVNGAFDYALATPAPEGALDLRTLLTHEIGHALGLAHSLSPSAVMRAGIKPGRIKHELHDDDRKGCAALGFSATGWRP